MTSRPPKLRRFDPARGQRPAASPAAEVAERLLGALLGLFVLTFAAGLLWLLLRAGPAFALAMLLPAAALLVIALFGLNLFWQCLLGRSQHAGFFYDGLRAVAALRPPVITLGIPAVLVLSALSSVVSGSPEGLDVSLTMLLAWLVIAAHIALHEAGHLAAAVGSGLTPRRLVIGPLELIGGPGAWRIGLCQEWFSLLGGLVEAEASGRPLTAHQELRFALGGPVATVLLLGALLLWNPYDLLGLLRMTGGIRNVIFSVGLGAGGAILLLNLLPLRNALGGIPSDGYRIYSALSRLRAQGRG